MSDKPPIVICPDCGEECILNFDGTGYNCLKCYWFWIFAEDRR